MKYLEDGLLQRCHTQNRVQERAEAEYKPFLTRNHEKLRAEWLAGQMENSHLGKRTKIKLRFLKGWARCWLHIRGEEKVWSKRHSGEIVCGCFDNHREWDVAFLPPKHLYETTVTGWSWICACERTRTSRRTYYFPRIPSHFMISG